MDNSDGDALLSLAFSMHSTPGAYAALIGAGVSIPSGIPAAWEVLEDLISRAAEAVEDGPGDHPAAWYEGRFGEVATYGTVLQRLAPTRDARQQILREYFERSPEDVDLDRKAPTDAHRSLARLVRNGTIRVIITLNFDRLIEQALRDEGIEPTIVSSAPDAAGVGPLHTLACCVIHLHGDYLNPTSMLNTEEELTTYRPDVRKLLVHILQNYGLIIAGWSCRWDEALRQAIATDYPSRLPLAWIEPFDQGPEAQSLLVLKRGLLMRADANSGFTRLADAVEAMSNRHSRHPLTVAVAIETAKRELATGRVPIRLHDTLSREFAALHAHPDFHLLEYQDDASLGGYVAVLDDVEEAMRISCALVATLARWGDDSTDAWWLAEIRRFCLDIRGSGLTRLLSLRRVVATALIYSAGVAALAGRRTEFVTQRLLLLALPHQADGSSFLAARDLEADRTYSEAPLHGRRLTAVLRPMLQEVLAVGDDALEDAWQSFEVHRLARALMWHPQFTKRVFDHNGARTRQMNAVEDLFRAKAEGISAIEELTKAVARTKEETQSTLEAMADLVPVTRPHVLTEGMGFDGWTSPVAERLTQEATSGEFLDPLNHTSDPSTLQPGNAMIYALSATSLALGRVGSQLAGQEAARSGGGAVPNSIWLDTAKSPEETTRCTG